ncbi:SGNH/GDSL hydrolase family protein [Arthrobacter sp. NPDC090010]|uniref:SGNH/GDSL hydrolase family protein n=1 Tax=Arthrobacter sp. NPDC090010 TaxID=3363942 RepID=UPI003815B38B
MKSLPRRTLLLAASLALLATAGIAPQPMPPASTEATAGSLPPAVGGTVGRQAPAVLSLRDGAPIALLVGDSQAGGAAGVHPEDTWPQRGLGALGYSVRWVGAGGTGYVASRPRGHASNYLDAFRNGNWRLPAHDPALIVLEGGGNDANQGKSAADVASNCRQLVYLLHRRYPSSRMVMVGVLSRAAHDGGGARIAMDSVLADTARELRVPFVDPGGWITHYRLGGSMADGVHLKPQGHDVLTTVFAEAIRATLD